MTIGIILSDVMLSVTFLIVLLNLSMMSVIVLNVLMPSLRFSYCYAECQYAECCCFECHFSECRCAECRGALLESPHLPPVGGLWNTLKRNLTFYALPNNYSNNRLRLYGAKLALTDLCSSWKDRQIRGSVVKL